MLRDTHTHTKAERRFCHRELRVNMQMTTDLASIFKHPPSSPSSRCATVLVWSIVFLYLPQLVFIFPDKQGVLMIPVKAKAKPPEAPAGFTGECLVGGLQGLGTDQKSSGGVGGVKRRNREKSQEAPSSPSLRLPSPPTRARECN